MIKNIIKGFIIGIGKIIPGVSGSLLAISLGVYEKVLDIVANLHKINFKKLIFLFSLLIGFVISLTLFSGTVKWLLEHFYFPIMLLFIGLIFGGLPELFNEINQKIKKRNIFIFLISLILCYLLGSLDSIDSGKNNNFMYIFLGLIEAFSSIVPGISGTAIYMSLGCYEMLLDFFSNIFNPHYFKFALFFGLGLFVGTIILAKLITYLLKHYKVETYFSILGFMGSSIIIMFMQAFQSLFKSTFNGYVLLEIIIGFIFLFLGFKLTIKINSLLSK